MKSVILSFIMVFLAGCASTEEPTPFTFTDEEIAIYQDAYLNRDGTVFSFVLVSEAGAQGSVRLEEPNSGNLNLLRNYGVVYLVIINENGRVTHRKLIAGQRNMRGNNAVFYNQVITSVPFNADEQLSKREFVVPVTLTYPLETY